MMQERGPEFDFRKAREVSQTTVRPKKTENVTVELVYGLAGESNSNTFESLIQCKRSKRTSNKVLVQLTSSNGCTMHEETITGRV